MTTAVPELQVYRFWDRPIGPHPVAMFEVDLATPEQFGAFVPWLAVWRGDLSVLVHPNTDAVQRGPDGADEPKWVTDRRDHTDRAIWLGQRVPLDTAVFRPKQLP